MGFPATREIKERLNLYVCKYGCHTVTVDVDKGVTPFMIDCRREGTRERPLDPKLSKNGKCAGFAKSSMYPRTISENIPYPKPTHEWFKPSKLNKDVYLDENGTDLKLTDWEKQHVDDGGLLLRKRTGKAPILHDQ